MRFSSRFSALIALLTFAAAFSFPPVVLAAENGVVISRIYTGWREAASFKRISEYFSGQENTGGALVLRTHADQRSGFYFFLRASNAGTAVPVKINVELIAPNDTKPKTYTFAADLKPGENVVNLGLTGDDWPDAKANPVAWKIDLVNAEGRVLAVEKSYLWEKPSAK